MKTILFNITTNEPLKRNGQVVQYDGGFYVDGKKPNYPNIVELEVVRATPPAYYSSTHKLAHHDFAADVANGKWKDSFTIEPLTSYELAARDWKHANFAKKLTISQQVIFSETGSPFYAWFELNGNPIEFDGTDVLVWIDAVQPQHQTIFDNLATAGLLTVTDRPTILDPA